MAERLESFEFRGRGGLSGSKYDEYLDGGIYRLKFGADIKDATTAVLLRNLARRRGVKIHVHTEPDALVVQAYSPEGTPELRRVV